jgi:hypothetical protein
MHRIVADREKCMAVSYDERASTTIVSTTSLHVISTLTRRSGHCTRNNSTYIYISFPFKFANFSHLVLLLGVAVGGRPAADAEVAEAAAGEVVDPAVDPDAAAGGPRGADRVRGGGVGDLGLDVGVDEGGEGCGRGGVGSAGCF